MQKENKTPPALPPALPRALPVAQPAGTKKGKPFAITSIVIAAIGLLPLIVYTLICINIYERKGRLHFDLFYGYVNEKPDLSIMLMMGFIGLVLHGVGLGCGITGLSLRSKTVGLIGMIANIVILGAICLFGFMALA